MWPKVTLIKYRHGWNWPETSLVVSGIIIITYKMKHVDTDEKDWTTGHGRPILGGKGDLEEIKNIGIGLMISLGQRTQRSDEVS